MPNAHTNTNTNTDISNTSSAPENTFTTSPLHLPLFPAYYLVLDTETAPNFDKNNPKTEVIQIGAILLELSDTIQAKIVNRFNTLIKPAYAIPLQVTKALHITNEMVQNAPNIAQVLTSQKFNSLLSKAQFIVGHNLSYDIRSIKESLQRSTEAQPTLSTLSSHKLFTIPQIDTLKLVKQVLKKQTFTNTHKQQTGFIPGITNSPTSYKLKHIAQALQISFNKQNLHSALYDASLTAKILYKLLIILNKDYKIQTYQELGEFIAKGRVVRQLRLV